MTNEFFNKNLKFPEHTKEKLSSIKYYYNIWFEIVKRQKAYIIDCYAGTGYCIIKNETSKTMGSALIAVDLFKKDENKNLKVFLINNNPDEYKILETNVLNYIKKNNIKAEIGSEIIIINDDWKSVIDEILQSTSNGIRLFLLDPYGIKSIPWNRVNLLIKNGISEFGYKESGFEVLKNWPWHKIKRIVGDYYKNKESSHELSNLNIFFDPIKWQEIVDKYPKDIFLNENTGKIEELAYKLVKAYVSYFFKYFRYVKVHPVHYRKKRKEPHLKDKGKIKYFLIFASNYYEALNIIDKPFKDTREAKIFYSLPNKQKTLSEWGIKKRKNPSSLLKEPINIYERIRKLEEELGEKLFLKNKEIIQFLCEQKNYDYGCPDFILFEKFNIDNESYLPYLLENKIIDIRKKRSKSGNIINYYYLIHPILVDRTEYLFLNKKVFRHENGSLINIEIKE